MLTTLSMNPLSETKLDCPYCGESIDIFIDDSLPHQNYIEDCQVCCRPIILDVIVEPDGEITLVASHENE